MTSTTLEGDWVDASSYITAGDTIAIDSELESVTVNISASDIKRFFRVEVTLDAWIQLTNATLGCWWHLNSSSKTKKRKG